MTSPRIQAPAKERQKRMVWPTSPPCARSRKGIAFSAAAAEGRLKLQKCVQCSHVTYPPRDVCPKCWSVELDWVDISDGGTLVTETTLHTSTNTYFRERMPWRIGTLQLDAGPSVLAHIHGGVEKHARVRVIARTDKSGQGVLMALPEKEDPHMSDDRQLGALTCDPKFRRVLITDGRTELGQSVSRAVADAGASSIFVGIDEEAGPFPGRKELNAIPGVEIMRLAVTDTDSVRELARVIGGKTDILINTAEHGFPGGAMERGDVVTAREEMEVNYFGLLRLIQAFGPAMRHRGTDAENSACAWVNLLSVYALSNWAAFGTTSASQAAAYSLSQCLRAEMAGSGIKVVNVLFGPLDDSLRQSVPQPKVTPERLARSVVESLQQGIESVALGPVAEDVMRRYREDPMVLERELAQIRVG